jgi:hypothetical protein
MTSEPSNPPEGASPAELPQTMALQGLVNRIMRGLMRLPLISRGIGRRLITIYVVGRKTGRRYAIPVTYTRQGEVLLVGTPFAWGRNLRTGEPVNIRLLGELRHAEVEVISDQAGVVEQYAVIARDNANFAGFNKIGFEPDGTPKPADLIRAWAAGARVIRLTPR